ncbi:MAG: MraY family glycosyltransferase [Bacteroidota bacterium]
MSILFIIGAILSTSALAFIAFPAFINYLNEHQVLDLPDHRKHHMIPTPSGGGFVFILSAGLSTCAWGYLSGAMMELTPLLATMLLLATGLIDDFKGMKPLVKLGLQGCAAIALLASGNGITNLQGILGVYEIPVWAQWGLGLVLVVGFINAFNLIDGVDGLAGGLATLIVGALSVNAYAAGDMGMALMGFSLVAGLLVFLTFNFHPAKIFMGDTGSLCLGFLIAFMVMRSFSYGLSTSTYEVGLLSPLMVLSLLMVPMVDTIQVFSTRILLGLSPLTADRRHTHHLMMRTHMNAPQVSVALWAIAAIAFALGGILSATWGFLILLGFGLFGIGFLRVQLLVMEEGRASLPSYRLTTRLSLIVFALVSFTQLMPL